MTDRLTIINDALLATGNNGLNVEFDGSVEWLAADSAYRRAVSFLLGRHVWNFGSTSTALTSRLLASPHPIYTAAYDLPGDCLHVEGVWHDNGSGAYPLARYEIVDQKICCMEESALTVKYVRQPSPEQWPVLFIELVTMKVEAYLLRGLNEDMDGGRRRDGEVEAMLRETRPVLDAQQPARAVLNSRSARARRGRKAW
jgi:hypothetical protein